ncbi:hypothetical protein GCM10029992_51080 [Glycomyces albus]
MITPQPDASHDVVSVKDPTVVRYNGEWLVYMTTADSSGAWGLAYTSFADWSQAPDAPQTFLDTNPNLADWYTAAPHLFYFEPRDEWYLVYQTGPPSYSVSKDPTDPNSWSVPRQFMDVDGLLDFWVICDDTMCYLFSADDDGRVYRAETTVGEFPNGFRDNQVVLQDEDPKRLFEGGAVYKVDGTDQYLLIWEAGDSEWTRYYRAFTATSLDGPWEPLAAEEWDPFAHHTNVTFPEGAWTEHISHGELIRSGHDQRMTVDPCNLQLLYQGHSPTSRRTPPTRRCRTGSDWPHRPMRTAAEEAGRARWSEPIRAGVWKCREARRTTALRRGSGTATAGPTSSGPSRPLVSCLSTPVRTEGASTPKAAAPPRARPRSSGTATADPTSNGA